MLEAGHELSFRSIPDNVGKPKPPQGAAVPGFFTARGRGGAADLLLSPVAGRLGADGFRLAGVVQENLERAGQARCDMIVRILGRDREIRISQRLGPGSAGCRLDTAGLVKESLKTPTDLLIINKLGKQELDGQGFPPGDRPCARCGCFGPDRRQSRVSPGV